MRATRRFWSSFRSSQGSIRSSVAPSTASWAHSVPSTVVDPTMWQRMPCRWQASARAYA